MVLHGLKYGSSTEQHWDAEDHPRPTAPGEQKTMAWRFGAHPHLDVIIPKRYPLVN